MERRDADPTCAADPILGLGAHGVAVGLLHRLLVGARVLDAADAEVASQSFGKHTMAAIEDYQTDHCGP
jgi:hypothetical protein